MSFRVFSAHDAKAVWTSCNRIPCRFAISRLRDSLTIARDTYDQYPQWQPEEISLGEGRTFVLDPDWFDVSLVEK